MKKIIGWVLFLAISNVTLAAEVCIVAKDVFNRSADGEAKFIAVAECTEETQTIYRGEDKASPMMAKAKLLKQLVRRGYHPKTNELFVMP